MAVERLTDYTRRIWTALAADAPEGHDILVNDVIYYMDTSECAIVTYVYPEGSIDVEFLPDIGGGGGGTLITKTITTNGTFTAADDGVDGYSSVTTEVYPYSHELTVTNNGPGDRQYGASIAYCYTPRPGTPQITNGTLRGDGRTLNTHIPASSNIAPVIIITIPLDVTFVISNGGRVALSGTDSAYPTSRIYVIKFPAPDSSDPQHYTITINPAS